MSHRMNARREKTFEEEKPQQYTWIVYAIGMLLVGGLAGYILSVTAAPAAPVNTATSAPASAPASGGGAGMVNEAAMKTYRDILARDPKNFQAAVDAGNMLYDAKRYGEAIPFYQQAMAANGSDVNVSTDLGTALWYSGRPDEALAQYAVSLAIAPNHAQTLFNVGIVKSDGKKDYPGAIQAWEMLLERNPTYANAASVRTMIADARNKK